MSGKSNRSNRRTHTRNTQNVIKESGSKETQEATKSGRSRRTKHTQSGSKHSKPSKRSSKSKRTTDDTKTEDTQESHKSRSGLAPPNNVEFDALKKEALEIHQDNVLKKAADKDSGGECVFDKTQWESTCWGKREDKVQVKKKSNVPALADPTLQPAVGTSPTPVPGEVHQEAGDKGDYLLTLPIVSIVLVSAEIGVAVLAVLLSVVGSRFGIFGVYITSGNLTGCIVSAGFLLACQTARREVVCDVTPQGHQRYRNTGTFKKFYFNLHFLRAILFFNAFVILLYYGTCGDQRAGFSHVGFCHDPPYAGTLFLMSSVLSLIGICLVGVHLFYVKRGTFAIVSLCGRANN